MHNIQQQYLEQLLTEKTLSYPDFLHTRRHSVLVGVNNSEDGVPLSVITPEGGHELKADYLRAADGTRAPVKSMLCLQMNWGNLPRNYIIADIRMEHDFPTERRSFFESKANPDATILIHKKPEDIWRVDWQILDDQDHDEAMQDANIRAGVRAIQDMTGHPGPRELER